MSLSPEQVRMIEIYAARKWNSNRIAKKMNISIGAASYRMLRAGYDPFCSGTKCRANRGKPFSDDDDAQLRALVAANKKPFEIAAVMKRSSSSVRQRAMLLATRDKQQQRKEAA